MKDETKKGIAGVGAAPILLSGGDTATTTNGAGTTGAYSDPVASLAEETTYYFRAYATNGEGTSYGSILNFTTESSSPDFLLNIKGSGTLQVDGSGVVNIQ